MGSSPCLFCGAETRRYPCGSCGRRPALADEEIAKLEEKAAGRKQQFHDTQREKIKLQRENVDLRKRVEELEAFLRDLVGVEILLGRHEPFTLFRGISEKAEAILAALGEES